MAKEEAFLGRGWSFPPTFNLKEKQVVMVSGEADIQESLQILLSTKIGERIMQTGYGSKLDDLLFEAITTTFLTFLQSQIRRAIAFYEPRIELQRLNILTDRITAGLILIDLEYTTRSTNTRNNLVFPFYISEGTEIPV